MGTHPQIVLASGSVWRRKMFLDAGIAVESVTSGVDEEQVVTDDPVLLATTLARLKAEAVRVTHMGAWVIGADQVVFDGGEIFGKPRDATDHFARLRSMRGRSHELVTGYVVLGPDFEHIGHERTRLWVRADLSDDELLRYVETREGSHSAGGYAIEGQGAFLFERTEGDWFNILGLPLLRVLEVLRAHGWRYGDAP